MDSHETSVIAEYDDESFSDGSRVGASLDFGFDIEEMDSEQQRLLFAKAELRVIDSQLESLIERIQSTRQALDLPSSDKELLAKRTDRLQRELKVIKARREQLVDSSGQLDLPRFLKAIKEEQDKLDRLKEAKDTLDKDVFKEEKKRIEKNVDLLKKNVDDEVKLAKKWIKGMKRELKALKKELTRLEAKLKIGDVSIAIYESRRNEIDRKVEIIEGGMNSLNELLHTAREY
jgi:chromosome segregation ATPase